LLKHLVVQALGITSSSISDRVSKDFNATRMAGASTAEHWVEILKHALSNISLVYIVVDLGLLSQADEYQNEVAQLFIYVSHLVEICKPTKLKCALINRGRVSPKDYKLSITAVLNASKTTSASPRVPRQGRHRPGDRRGALAFRKQLK
jgi:hypothetical protein